jgi:ABC-2 type transport system permease protein
MRMVAVLQYLRPLRLTGPIFDKELRVSSRRRRNYVLRFLYIGFFTMLLALAWANVVMYGTSAVYQASRMAAAGLRIMTTVVWFQFLAAQVMALVMLSTSISDEIYHRTLGVLMTTPIGSAQIVLGKLFSKLLQLVLLLAITLPLLAIVRVFGGVPWGFLVCSLCVTLTTVTFIGSLSLFFSIFTRRAYVVILTTILMLGFLFLLLPLMVGFLVYYPSEPTPRFFRLLSYGNPYLLLGMVTERLYLPAPGGMASWPVHCGVMSGLAALVLLLATVVVRKVALRQATGQTGLWSPRGGRTSADEQAGDGRLRRVVGPPVLWKERRLPLWGRRKVTALLGTLAVLGILGLTYELCDIGKVLGDREIQGTYIIILMAIGVLFTMVVPATCVAAERESRAWPLLLTTTVSNDQILSGKLLGAMYRCLPAWALLFGHVLIFVVAGTIHPVALVQLGILAAWLLLFLSSTGLFFSTCLKHTTTAVIANMALAAGLWAVAPLLLGLTLALTRARDDLLELYVDLNPFVHAGVIAGATANHGKLTAYSWMQSGISDLSDATGWMVLTFVIYVAVALVFFLLARVRLRSNPF